MHLSVIRYLLGKTLCKCDAHQQFQSKTNIQTELGCQCISKLLKKEPKPDTNMIGQPEKRFWQEFYIKNWA